jgi:hypothetical protein
MTKQNTPLARAILSNALENAETLEQAQQAIASALGHMYRRAPDFSCHARQEPEHDGWTARADPTNES